MTFQCKIEPPYVLFESEVFNREGNPDVCGDADCATQRADNRTDVTEIVVGDCLAAIEGVDLCDRRALLSGLIAEQVAAVRGVRVAENDDAAGSDSPARWMVVVACGHLDSPFGVTRR